MYFVVGLGLIVLSAAMIVIARPPKGMDVAPFMRSWIVAQGYVLGAMVSAVLGVILVINDFPL